MSTTTSCLELLAVVGRDLADPHDRFRVVAVHVEDRRLDDLRHLRRIGRGARLARARGEADLVVDDDVDGAAGAGSRRAARARSVSEHVPWPASAASPWMQQPHDPLCGPCRVRIACLARTLAEHDRVDGLEVRRVGVSATGGCSCVRSSSHAVGRRAEVVLDVAGALHVAGWSVTPSLELGEDRLA